MKIKGFAEIMLGFWLLASAFVGFASSGAIINNFIVGIVVVIVSFLIVRSEPWQSWIAGILGFWLIVASCIPFLVSGIGLYLNDIIVGSLIMVVGLSILVPGKKFTHYVDVEKHFNYRDYGSE